MSVIISKISARILPRIKKKKFDFSAKFQRLTIKSDFIFDYSQNSGDPANNSNVFDESWSEFRNSGQNDEKYRGEVLTRMTGGEAIH